MLIGDIGLPPEYLDGTPFGDYTIPAVILGVAVGGTSLAAAWSLWKRKPVAGEASIVAGAVLLGWIVTEFVMIPQGWLPQLLYFVIALAILRLGWQRREDRGAIWLRRVRRA